MKKKAVLIGCGSIGGFKPDHVENENTGIISHGHAINVFCEAVAAIDPDEEKRNYVGNKWRFQNIHADVKEIKSPEEIDLWVIATPPETHLAVFEEILQWLPKKTVIIEKPVGASKEEAEAIAVLAGENDVRVVVNYQRCYLPDYQNKSIVDLIGATHEIILHYCRGFIRDASHFFALLEKWGTWIIDPRAGYCGYPDYSLEDTTFDAMADGLHIIAHDGRIADIFQVEIVGRHGRLVYEDHGKLLCFYPHKKELTFGDYYSWGNIPEITINTGLDNGLAFVYEAVLSKETFYGVTIEDAVKIWNMMCKFLEVRK